MQTVVTEGSIQLSPRRKQGLPGVSDAPGLFPLIVPKRVSTPTAGRSNDPVTSCCKLLRVEPLPDREKTPKPEKRGDVCGVKTSKVAGENSRVEAGDR